MTRKSRSRLERDRQGIPRRENISKVVLDHERKQRFILTNDMLINQLQRDGPRVARSFDKLMKTELVECSKLFSSVQGMLLRHLPRVDDEGFKATSARLLSSAANSYVASIEVARHGFPRQHGALVRMVIETLATVVVLATKPEALAQFHSGKLSSSKCVSWANKSLPLLGPLWGMLSNEFVHIGLGHSTLEMPSKYSADDEALSFLRTSLVSSSWLLHMVTELVFSDETPELLYWTRSGDKVVFDPSTEGARWMDEHLS